MMETEIANGEMYIIINIDDLPEYEPEKGICIHCARHKECVEIEGLVCNVSFRQIYVRPNTKERLKALREMRK